MRISDWSSDVCSSDLCGALALRPLPAAMAAGPAADRLLRRPQRRLHRQGGRRKALASEGRPRLARRGAEGSARSQPAGIYRLDSPGEAALGSEDRDHGFARRALGADGAGSGEPFPARAAEAQAPAAHGAPGAGIRCGGGVKAKAEEAAAQAGSEEHKSELQDLMSIPDAV